MPLGDDPFGKLRAELLDEHYKPGRKYGKPGLLAAIEQGAQPSPTNRRGLCWSASTSLRSSSSRSRTKSAGCSSKPWGLRLLMASSAWLWLSARTSPTCSGMSGSRSTLTTGSSRTTARATTSSAPSPSRGPGTC